MLVKLLCGTVAPGFIRRHQAFVAGLHRPCARIGQPRRDASVVGRVLQRGRSMSVRHQHVSMWNAPRSQVFLPTRETRVVRQTHTQVLREHLRAWVEKIVTREQQVRTRLLEHRIERQTQTPMTAAAAPTVAPAAPARLAPPTMVVARPQAAALAATAQADKAAPAAAYRHAPETPAPFAPRAVPTALPAHELSRVTEHVIQALDRRVLSHRERHGQV